MLCFVLLYVVIETSNEVSVVVCVRPVEKDLNEERNPVAVSATPTDGFSFINNTKLAL